MSKRSVVAGTVHKSAKGWKQNRAGMADARIAARQAHEAKGGKRNARLERNDFGIGLAAFCLSRREPAKYGKQATKESERKV